MTHVAMYGNVSLLRGWCSVCKMYAFIIDGKYQCCDKPADSEDVQGPKRYKRMSSGELKRPSLGRYLNELMREQHGKCYWCGRNIEFGWYYRNGKTHKLKPHVDHYMAWVYSGDSSKNNLVLSCNVCNLLKSSFVFDTEEQAREYILRRWEEKGIEGV